MSNVISFSNVRTNMILAKGLMRRFINQEGQPNQYSLINSHNLTFLRGSFNKKGIFFTVK